MVKRVAWQPVEGGRTRLEHLQNHILLSLSLFDLSDSSLEDLTCKAVFMLPESEFALGKKPFPWREGRRSACQKQSQAIV